MTFIGHQFSTLLVCGTLHIPVVGNLLALFNHAVNLRLIRALDGPLGAQSQMPCMYFFVATNGSFTPAQLGFIQKLPGVMLSEGAQ